MSSKGAGAGKGKGAAAKGAEAKGTGAGKEKEKGKGAKVPKATKDFLTSVVETGSTVDADLAEKSMDLFERLFSAWHEAEKFFREEERAENPPKRKRDPIASSIGSAMNKMAKMSPDEQSERMEHIREDLRDSLAEKPLESSAAQLPLKIIDNVSSGLGIAKTDRVEKAKVANAAISSAANELAVPKQHLLRTAANDLYQLAVA